MDRSLFSRPPGRPNAPRLRAQVLQIAAVAALCVHGPVAAQQDSPAGPVPPRLLEARRSALLAALGDGVAVIPSAGALPDPGAGPARSYREASDFFYLTGLEAPGGWLVLTARQGAPGEVRLYLPTQAEGAEHWSGLRPRPNGETAVRTGIADVRDVRWLAEDVGAQVSEVGRDTLWAVLPVAVSAAQGQAAVLESLAGGQVAAVRDLRPLLGRLRSVKDAEEQRRLRRAAEITVAAQLAAAGVVRPGAWEYEVAAEVEYAFRRSGAERPGFPSIVGSGPNATVLHYEQNRRQMAAGEVVVVDVGAEFGYYTADVTRTWPVSGRFTARQRALHDLVLGALEAARERVRPGVTPAELNRAAREHLRRRSGALCGPATCEAYFSHGLSHSIGLEVHDPMEPGPLRAGMVLTLEPGVYLPGERLGLRIEDVVLVTATGHELLTSALPRTAAEVEEVMAASRRRLQVQPDETH